MPAKNVTKPYRNDSYYHLFNRGVEKRIIFQDDQDYSVFTNYLRDYLTPKEELIDALPQSSTAERIEREKQILRMNNFHNNITLMAYCLMPNHFHFLVKQKEAIAIHKFMISLATRYTMYFNRKYDRVGSLCQGVYKGVLVDTAEQLLYLTRYIHIQALGVQNKGETFKTGQRSSYPVYIGKEKVGWIHPEEILEQFSQTPNPKNAYKNYIETNCVDEKYIEEIKDIQIE